MKIHNLGKSGLKVSELCFGAMTFGQGGGLWSAIGKVGQSDANAMVKLAWEAGINFYDTANVYSYGQAEEILGRAFKDLAIPREQLVIATKVRGAMSQEAEAGTGDWNNKGISRKNIMNAVQGSLKRLGVDYIDLYQIHGWDFDTPMEEALEALKDLVRAGLVRYIGVSNWPARKIVRALAMQESNHWARFVSLQAYYSLVARDLEQELLPLVREEGLGLMVWSPLSGGYLSGKYRAGQTETGRRSAFEFPPIDPRSEAALAVLEQVAQAHGVSMATVALAWLLKQPGVTAPILGASKFNQLEQNLGAAQLDLSQDELATLSESTKPFPAYPNWMVSWMNERTVS